MWERGEMKDGGMGSKDGKIRGVEGERKEVKMREMKGKKSR